MRTTTENTATIDGAAAALSSICLVHCLALPLLVVLLPAISVGEAVHGPAWLHWLLIALALPVSAYALWRGLLFHGSRLPMALATGGFSLMAMGALLHDGGLVEPTLTISGGLLVAASHWKNWATRPA